MFNLAAQNVYSICACYFPDVSEQSSSSNFGLEYRVSSVDFGVLDARLQSRDPDPYSAIFH